ncbi:hypothetical protein NC99_14900 [Sunxiuqinia dokdonensis]|uniref:Uncharacterized protein n=1 Tax=Sunxiuqinia dokdonensis TaxID=1409788 RepID=A0A0L8VBG6_9BACT|nr:hypothetical protein NC99_14900 [Sunxiuqinia dokdonensis]
MLNSLQEFEFIRNLPAKQKEFFKIHRCLSVMRGKYSEEIVYLRNSCRLEIRNCFRILLKNRKKNDGEESTIE